MPILRKSEDDKRFRIVAAATQLNVDVTNGPRARRRERGRG
jgi:hypothetical protein